MLIELSKKGKNFKNRPLNEDNLKASIEVIYNHQLFLTANRYHDEVELYSNDKFIRIVKIKQIRLIRKL